MKCCVCLQRSFADNVGTRIVDSIAARLLDRPRNRAVIEGINDIPVLGPILDAVSAVAGVGGPLESSVLVSSAVHPPTRPTHPTT